LSKLVKMKWSENPKEHDIGILHRSLSRFGFVSPIIVSEEIDEVIAGHGRLDTLEQRWRDGQPAPDRCKVEDDEWLIPTIMGVKLEEGAARAYALADNRSVELGGWDAVLLASALTELASVDGLDGIGWDPDDVDDLVEMLKPPDLNSLAEQYGEPIDGDFWPIIRVQVAPSTYKAYSELLKKAKGSTEGEKFAAIINAVKL